MTEEKEGFFPPEKLTKKTLCSDCVSREPADSGIKKFKREHKISWVEVTGKKQAY